MTAYAILDRRRDHDVRFGSDMRVLIFSAGELLAVGEPFRHQVEELPVLSARVTEHRAQRVRCPG